MAKTKIISTIGPASRSEKIMRKLMLAGMDVIRLNFSHGTHRSHLDKVKTIRKLNQKYRRGVKVLQDLEGYRIRIGEIEPPKQLIKGKRCFLTLGNSLKNPAGVPLDYTGPLQNITPGQYVYIDDGKIVLKVIQVQKKKVKVRVERGGMLYSHKGVNIPGLKLSFSGLTEKDKKDLDFAFKHKPDFIAQSFVRTHKDVLNLKKNIGGKLPKCKIISKIENQEGVKNIDKIVDASDLVMIARGDLGVCLPFQKVPFVQKQIIKKCRRKKKKVIVATQMLETMVENFIPSRAEVSDIANAVLDGAHMLLLSSETAKGKYPVESVKVMDKVIKYTEKNISSF